MGECLIKEGCDCEEVCNQTPKEETAIQNESICIEVK